MTRQPTDKLDFRDLRGPARALRIGWQICLGRAVLAGALSLISAASLAAGWDMAGEKLLRLHARNGESLDLGRVHFEPRADGSTAFRLALDHERFKDHFLSMREFKCLEGQGEIMCHVPYPYAQPGTVTPQDLAWLEHSLMFMFKTPAEFGAKLWNGVYFQLRLTEQGLEGRPQAIDLNRIGAPPERPEIPPFRAALRDDIRPDARWFNRLTIE